MSTHPFEHVMTEGQWADRANKRIAELESQLEKIQRNPDHRVVQNGKTYQALMAQRDRICRERFTLSARLARSVEALREAITIIDQHTKHKIDFDPKGPPTGWGCRVGLTDLEESCRCWRRPAILRLKAALVAAQETRE